MSRQQDTLEAAEASLEKFLGMARSPGSTQHPWGGCLSFSETGKARLAHIAGLIQGLVFSDEARGPMEQLADAHRTKDERAPRTLALRLAASLDDRLSCLAQYGGMQEYEVDKGRTKLIVPRYKVVLHDDNSFGSFSIAWYCPYSTDEVQKVARGFDEASYQGKEADGTELSDDEQSRRWREALQTAEEKLRLYKKLDEFRSYTPQWVRDAEAEYKRKHYLKPRDEGYEVGHEGDYIRLCKKCGISQYMLSNNTEFYRYGYAFNGGLILHGMGKPNFDVSISGDDGPHWGIHT